MKIYINSYLPTEELTPDNFLEELESFTSRLEGSITVYKKLISFIKDKKINIEEAQGFASGGYFLVDDIDSERLKKEDLVLDFADDLPMVDEFPLFYIDALLDEALAEEEEDYPGQIMLPDISYQEPSYSSKDFPHILNPDFEKDLSIPTEPYLEFLHNKDSEDINLNLDDYFEEKTTTFNLLDKLIIPETSSDEFIPGNMMMDVKKLGEDKYVFNLAMADLNGDPVDVDFIREKSVFEYNCGNCDSIHSESLNAIYSSLKTTNAILSNLIVMSKDYKELSTALEFIDSDLRLLQWLLALDYALEEDPTEIPDSQSSDSDD